eukprot:Tbor_TRINITY_DN5361_c0_g1::TRINITY_DN5361_c0_g1_i1::g.4507::m.4507/K01090/E3.1.3.16; protein phosphatase
MNPPIVPDSPQQVHLDHPVQAAGNLKVEQLITIEQAHAVSINRGQLYDWHHKIRSKLFPLASGFFVRCRVEDSTEGRALYKLARIKNLKPDWTVELDFLTTDEIRAGRNNTNFDCISNTKVTVAEYMAWLTKLSPDVISNVSSTISKMEERLRLMESFILTEPVVAGKKKDEKKNTVTDKFCFSNNVLLCEDDGIIPRTVTIIDLLNNCVGVRGVSEPDTPRQSYIANTRPKSVDEALASNSTMVQLSDVQSYMNSPVAPPADAAKLIETLRKSATNNYTQFNYDSIPELAKLVISVCNQCKEIVAKEPLFLRLQSPCTVFGDIHGNFADMMFFLQKVIAFDDIMLKYTTTSLLFLGDYVDRGALSLECVMYLMALKVINPGKVSMLRGNHESPEVNGDMDVYGYSSFKYQCLDKFGRERGLEVWVAVNEVFQYFPVIADIDKRIFCVHGGLPQYSGGEDKRLEILADPNFPRVPVVQCNDPSNVTQRMIINDLLWSDPASTSQPVDKYGFGPNPRGPDIKTFGSRAVDMFCERYGYQYIFRAHQEKSDGLRVSDNARVVTIFSTSDYAGHQNGAGCVLVHNGKIRMAIKKPVRHEQKEMSIGSRGTSPRTMGKSPLGFVSRGRK